MKESVHVRTRTGGRRASVAVAKRIQVALRNRVITRDGVWGNERPGERGTAGRKREAAEPSHGTHSCIQAQLAQMVGPNPSPPPRPRYLHDSQTTADPQLCCHLRTSVCGRL